MPLNNDLTIKEVEQLTDVLSAWYEESQEEAAVRLNDSDVSIMRADIEKGNHYDIFVINPADPLHEVITIQKTNNALLEMVFPSDRSNQE